MKQSWVGWLRHNVVIMLENLLLLNRWSIVLRRQQKHTQAFCELLPFWRPLLIDSLVALMPCKSRPPWNVRFNPRYIANTIYVLVIALRRLKPNKQSPKPRKVPPFLSVVCLRALEASSMITCTRWLPPVSRCLIVYSHCKPLQVHRLHIYSS